MATDRRARESDNDDNQEEGEGSWLTSYSDLMTDLLAIFVILYAFAMIELKVYKKSDTTTASAGQASAVVALSSEQGGQTILPEQIRFNSLYEAISSHITEAGLVGQLSVAKQGDDTVLLRMADSALFDSGRAVIKSDADQLLDNIAAILTEYADFIKMVRIEGHTDNRPINTLQFGSNWELSTTRAVNVLRRLLEISQMEPEKYSAVGYSEFYPIADNDTPEGRALNRRVDFIIETIID